MKPPQRKPLAGAPALGQARPRPGFPASLSSFAPAGLSGQVALPSRPKVATAVQPPRPVPSPVGLGLDSSAVRQAMVTRLAAHGVEHAAVLGALGAVERHRFVDSALVNQAYEDTSLPIGLGQTISKPSVVARMLSLLLQGREAPLGRVLEIGTGCGYQAALLGRLAREVYSIERLRALHEKARANLRHLPLNNLHLIFGDGMQGYARGAQYDGIIAAAAGDGIPEAWIDQLAPGGRLVAPMGVGRQCLVVIDKTERACVRTVLEPVHFVPLKSGIA